MRASAVVLYHVLYHDSDLDVLAHYTALRTDLSAQADAHPML